jgi:ADP-ribose pyrophosphatase
MNATVNQSILLRRGRVFDFTLENVTLETGVTVDMEIIRHPGAAAIVPLTDDRQVLMLKQYRHAAGQSLWEIPAGTLEKMKRHRNVPGVNL